MEVLYALPLYCPKNNFVYNPQSDSTFIMFPGSNPTIDSHKLKEGIAMQQWMIFNFKIELCYKLLCELKLVVENLVLCLKV